MKILKRSLIVVLTLVILAVLAVFIYMQTTKPVYSGSIALQGLHEEVEVRFDTYGVPHIYAKGAEDAYFALAFRGVNPLDDEFEAIAQTVFGPMQEALDEESLT